MDGDMMEKKEKKQEAPSLLKKLKYEILSSKYDIRNTKYGILL
jgi:hypothetical protein